MVLLVGTWAGILPAVAQYTSDYQTNTVSGVTNYWPGDYVVGSNTFADALLILKGGALSNADGYVGYLPASNTNYVMVTGAGSVWTNNFMYLGYSGGGNTLVISNAGCVNVYQGTYIGNNGTSSSNRVLVVGTNSIWNGGSQFFLGYSGSGNSLVISNGGQVANGMAYVGEVSASSNNSALITGTNSVWNNSACLIGDSGSSNRMIIYKGGRVTCTSATLGYFGSATGNMSWVSDSNSVWDVSAVAANLNVGLYGPGNSIVVTNGGQILGYYVYVGSYSSGNSVLVTGPGSSLSANCYIYTGDLGNNNTFTVANGAAISDKICYIGYAAGSSNNAVLLTDTNSSWQNTYSTYVGFDGVAASLTISNGATMSVGGGFTPSHDGALGVNSDSSNNRALVTGGGSLWNCADRLFVGLNGPANSMVISNGGQVSDTEGYVGSNPGSDGNSAVVTGVGSVWINNGDLNVGYFASDNSLTINNGGLVLDNYGYIGQAAGSDSNSVTVAGSNSVWDNNSDVYVGYSGMGNSLVISNGGWVINGYAYIGPSVGSDSNSVTVVGSGSVWTNYYDVNIGYSGTGNSLMISNGGLVTDYNGWLGYTNNCYNQALVVGAGSVWSNANALLVGDFGVSNSLVIGNGGLVVDYWGLVGQDASGSDNTVLVESGGIWRNQELAVGDLGSQNALFVEGGSVYATNVEVGYDSLYCDNLVQLDSGQILVTNQTHSAVLEVYDGTFVLNGGTLRVDTLLVTNDCAQFLHVGGTLIYRTLQLNPNQSAVGDGIPNWWKLKYGFDPLDPTVAGADPDHDGENNLEEYLAGTNPTNSASVFHIISAAKTNQDMRVTWSTVGGHSYVLQTNGNLGASTFADFSPLISVGGTNEGTTNYLDPGAVTNYPSRFYRIRLGP